MTDNVKPAVQSYFRSGRLIAKPHIYKQNKVWQYRSVPIYILGKRTADEIAIIDYFNGAASIYVFELNIKNAIKIRHTNPFSGKEQVILPLNQGEIYD